MDTFINLAQDITEMEESNGSLLSVVLEHTSNVVDGIGDLFSIFNSSLDVVQDLFGVDVTQKVTDVEEFNTNSSRTSTDDGTDLLGSLDDLDGSLGTLGNTSEDLTNVDVEEFVVILEHTSDVIDGLISLLNVVDTLIELVQNSTDVDESSGEGFLVVVLEDTSDVVNGTNNLLGIMDTLVDVVQKVTELEEFFEEFSSFFSFFTFEVFFFDFFSDEFSNSAGILSLGEVVDDEGSSFQNLLFRNGLLDAGDGVLKGFFASSSLNQESIGVDLGDFNTASEIGSGNVTLDFFNSLDVALAILFLSILKGSLKSRDNLGGGTKAVESLSETSSISGDSQKSEAKDNSFAHLNDCIANIY